MSLSGSEAARMVTFGEPRGGILGTVGAPYASTGPKIYPNCPPLGSKSNPRGHVSEGNRPLSGSEGAPKVALRVIFGAKRGYFSVCGRALCVHRD